jgi:hypothetical protein
VLHTLDPREKTRDNRLLPKIQRYQQNQTLVDVSDGLRRTQPIKTKKSTNSAA